MVTNGMTLDKEDVQKFFKRLRKHHKKNKRDGRLKYYLAGEYGGHSYRPHYHIILFNGHYADVMEAWKINGEQIGQIHFGTVTEASIGYSLKYISKPKRIPLFANDHRTPEFALMSKGMGDNYITKAKIHWHHADLDNRYYIPLPDGKKAPIPRYYKDRIYNSEQFGHLKGVLERKAIEKEENDRKKDKNYDHRLLQYHISSFKQMHKNATQKNKIDSV